MKNIVLMSSAAGVALVVAAGSAQAADVMMPIVVPVVTPAVVPVPGPVKVLRVDSTVSFSTSSMSIATLDTTAAVDIRSASGWGFQLIAANSLLLNGTFDSFYTIGGRVYRAIGDGTIGVFANAGFAGGFAGATVGIDADYKTDTADIFYALGANFNGGFDGLQSIFSASVERGNFHVDVLSVVEVPDFSAFGLAKLGYQLGSITPYVQVGGGISATPGALGIVGAGLDFEHDVGERLTLTANAELDLLFTGMGTALVWQAEAGFEYTLGAHDGPLSIHGNIGTGTGGGVTLEFGIGLKFGAGRVTGLGGVVFDGLPGLDFFL